jgi:hypothetical protein
LLRNGAAHGGLILSLHPEQLYAVMSLWLVQFQNDLILKI